MDASTLQPSQIAARQRWFVAGLLVLFVAFSVQYSFKVCNGGSAIERWRPQIHDLDQGANIYEKHNYPNPPIMAIVLDPIMQLPPLAGALVWYYLKVAMALASIAMVFRIVENPEQPFPAWGKALAVLLSLRPIMGDLSHGNVNLFILFVVVAALFAFRQRRDWTCGVLIGLAVCCKVTPALFLPYFIWKRSWKAVGGCVVGLVLFFWLVPGLMLGFGKNAELLGNWTDNMVKPFLVKGDVWSEHNNQSIPGLVQRLLTHNPSFGIYDEHPEYHNIVDLPIETTKWIVKGLMGLFALLIVWSCRTPTTTTRRGWRLGAEFSLVVLGMLLFSERTWKHHCVTMLLPFSVLAYYLSMCKPTPRLRALLIGSLAAVVLLMTSTGTMTSTSDGLLGGFERAAKLAEVYGAYVWAYLILVAALVVLLRQPESGVRSQESRVFRLRLSDWMGAIAKPQAGIQG